jgi:hypothetical protein
MCDLPSHRLPGSANPPVAIGARENMSSICVDPPGLLFQCAMDGLFCMLHTDAFYLSILPRLHSKCNS